MPRTRVAITTLGCKVNRADEDRLVEELGAEVELVPFTAFADVYIVNSCTVTATADRQTRQLVYRARRANPDGRVVLTGCLAATTERAGLPDGIDRAYAPRDHAGLAAYVRERATSAREADARSATDDPSAPRRAIRARPFVKVQDGCDHRCTYCVVPLGRGRERSTLAPAAVRARVEELAARGYREVVLAGIHLGHYGRDLDPPTSLSALLAGLVGPPLGARLRLSSIEPPEIDGPLVALLERNPAAICPHLHVPIQSGDERMLEAMNRPYRGADVRQILLDLRRRMPDLALGTDLIAGFPGETEAQHLASLRLIDEAPLTHLHVFPFSPRPGTAAADLPTLPSPVVRARAAALRQAGRGKLLEFAAAQIGRVRPVLVERADPVRHTLSGLTDNYLRVRFQGAPDLVGSLVEVKLHALEGAGPALLGAAVL